VKELIEAGKRRAADAARQAPAKEGGEK
jgi:hypothetical protein